MLYGFGSVCFVGILLFLALGSGLGIFRLPYMVLKASLLASDSLRKLRSSINGVVWSHRQPLASIAAVLSLLDGPGGCDLASCVVWFRFRLLRRYLALWPSEVRRVYRLLEMVGEGCVQFIFFLLALLRLAFSGILMPLLGLDLACLCLVIWLALFSISRLLFLMLDVTKLLLIFVGGRVLEVGLFWTFMVLCSSLILLTFEKEIRPLLRTIMVGGVWNGFLLGRVRGQAVPCRFCGAPDHDGHLFGECTFSTSC